MKIAIIGAGAAGMFFANQLLEQKHLPFEVKIFEKGRNPLAKVKISGGGRCNVTHACFDPAELVKFYPRGGKALRSGFSKFCTGDTMAWFESRGVDLKIESDNRIFPTTDSSQTIIDCLMGIESDYRLAIHYQEAVNDLRQEGEQWLVETNEQSWLADKVFVAGGSSKALWQILENIGLAIIPPVPSLFTFKVPKFEWVALAGLSLQNASVKIAGLKLNTLGPVLFTHWGFSGPAILRMSAEAAIHLHEKQYQFQLHINWLNGMKEETAIDILQSNKMTLAKQKINNKVFEGIPKRLWSAFLTKLGIIEKRWADLSKKEMHKLAQLIVNSTFEVNGKLTHKEEFVTAGGVKRSEIQFKNMEAKQYPNLHFGGEVLDIDAVTGGFNFQNAWTTAWVAAESIKAELT